MNSKCKILIVFSLILMLAVTQLYAERYKGPIMKPKKSPKAEAKCLPPTATAELSFNAVRALLKTNGTMWFREGGNAEYEVPRGSGKTSMFSAALWIGGQDDNGNVYTAVMRFAQVGNDYWTGPLRIKDAATDVPTCASYDKFYSMSRMEVERHKYAFSIGDEAYIANIPRSILEWPATTPITSGYSPFLAPFAKYDQTDGDPTQYQPEEGDYPFYDIDNYLCPWTAGNIEKAKRPPWLDADGNEDPTGLGVTPNKEALDMPPERIFTKWSGNYTWDTTEPIENLNLDNKMVYADHVLKGDQTYFWFLNDKGDVHTEGTGGLQIGLEIRVQAFAFATNDELNNMTFYSYEIINRGSTTLYNTYFSQWVDPDVGFERDDYVGCDVSRGLGYAYNGDEDDSGRLWAYGENPPAVGVDFFQGPYIDKDGMDNPRFQKRFANILGTAAEQEYCRKFVHYIHQKWPDGTPWNLMDTVDDQTLIIETESGFDTVPLRWNNQYAINGVNFGDGIIDNERFGMRRFVYHNNDNSNTGDPQTARDYYNMLRGIWRDNTIMTYGNMGYDPQSLIYADFMFPAGTDICNWGVRTPDPFDRNPGEAFKGGGPSGTWTDDNPFGDNSSFNPPDDRRFMQSAGPFTLERGACNYITVGIPWARTTSGGRLKSVELLMVADDKCQALFENCFKLIDGPDAPNLTIREYDQKLILFLTNPPFSNNRSENYQEDNPQIIFSPEMNCADSTLTDVDGPNPIDQTYRFEGYQIYQVSGPEVGAIDLDNPSLARLIAQCDIINHTKSGTPIGRLINFEFDETLQQAVPREKVNGSNTGIKHSFEVIEDAFASGDRRLVNYKTYYFIAVAYAYNEYLPYYVDQNDPCGLWGQKLPYLRGRRAADGSAVRAIPGIPHHPYVHGGALTLNSDYGTTPNIIRVDGQGNGGIALELTQATKDKIISGGDKGDYRVQEIEYEKNAGPLNIKIVDPLRVRPYDYTFFIREPEETMNDNTADISENAYWVLRIDDAVTDAELDSIGLVDDDGKILREVIPYEFRKITNSKDTAIIIPISKMEDYLILPLGLSVNIVNRDFVSTQPDIAENWNNILTLGNNNPYKAKLKYGQSEKIELPNNAPDIIYSNDLPWIEGLRDINTPQLPSNWIRAGSLKAGPVWNAPNAINTYNDYEKVRTEDVFYPVQSRLLGRQIKTGDSWAVERAFKDFSGRFASICNGTWAPYVLASPYDNGPQAKYARPEYTFGVLAEPAQNYYFTYEYRDGLYPSEFQERQVGQGRRIVYQNPAIHPGYNQTMTNLYSVDVVITPNKDLWTRCVVLESCDDPTKAQNSTTASPVLKNEPRRAISRDKNGNEDRTSKDGFDGPEGEGIYGMSWFPGYAINIETGERLNIMFAENSDISLNERFGEHVRGTDMWFNPTSAYAIVTQDNEMYGLTAGMVISREEYDTEYLMPSSTGSIGEQKMLELSIQRVVGGMHYVYVCNSAGNTSSVYYMNAAVDSVQNSFLYNARRNHNMSDKEIEFSYWQYQLNPLPPYNVYAKQTYGGFLDSEKKYPVYDCGPYDEGRWLVQKFKQFVNVAEGPGYKAPDPTNPQWPNNPIPHDKRRNDKMQLFNNVMYTHIPMQPADNMLQNQWLSGDVTYKIRVTRPYMRYISRWFDDPNQRDYDDGTNSKGFPVYKVSTKSQAPLHNDTRVYQKVLDGINIVPNPYYGGSLYEGNPLETKVKIINLPTDLKNGTPVTINIFTVNGILVRTLTKGDSETAFVDWDLKNFANIPVAGGVYIIHVNCPGIGERMLKFFCTMRPTDLNTF